MPRLIATDKDLEILSLFVRGNTYTKIEEQLNNTYKTIKSHIDGLVDKNTCENAEELVKLYADWEANNG